MAFAPPSRRPARTAARCWRPFRIRAARSGILLVALLLWTAPAPAQMASSAEVQEVREMLETFITNQRHTIDVLQRRVDDLGFFLRLGDVAEVEIIRYTGPPSQYQPNPTAQGAGIPLIIPAYVFIPRDLDPDRRHPLIVLPHGGVHSNFRAEDYVNILREMLEQGYTVIAPEYRGSTGYGRRMYEWIDYGGLENDDTYEARNWALERYSFLDPDRVGVVGWSHGGMHALFNIFNWPDAYAAAYAGVPVGDLIARMGYKRPEYVSWFSAEYHIGTTPEYNVEEYRRRSASWQAHRYDGTPLMITTSTNDPDVNVFEVERIIQALKAEGKQGFRYQIYDDAPGDHYFDRIDTELAHEARREMHQFLAEHLRPQNPMR